MPRYRACIAPFLILLMASCSQVPGDLAAPVLESQFGSAIDDIGEDVIVAPTGQVYALSGEFAKSRTYKVLLHRYSPSGALLWSTDVAYDNCSDWTSCESRM